jgi:fermentation-respiration switch protein FrsA (DUF1100 family)
MVQHAQDERSVRGGRRLTLTYRDTADVPAVLLVPPSGAPATSGALLLHGYTSRKEDMADSIGRALLTHGVASLSVDLPLHGERDGGADEMSMRNALDLVRYWSAAIEEATLGLRYLAARPEIDRARVAVVGYSLGAYLGLMVAGQNTGVAAVVLAAGGDLPVQSPFAAMIRPLIDPLTAVRGLAGRPLLMVNGRRDTTVRPDQAERLFAAAGEPKELRWYDGGHWLPPQAVQYGAEWLAARLDDRRLARP